MRKPKQEKYAYDARLALWPNRATIEENGGANFYTMVSNNVVGAWDYLGLQKPKCGVCGGKPFTKGANSACCAGEIYNPKNKCCIAGGAQDKIKLVDRDYNGNTSNCLAAFTSIPVSDVGAGAALAGAAGGAAIIGGKLAGSAAVSAAGVGAGVALIVPATIIRGLSGLDHFEARFRYASKVCPKK